MYTYSLDMYVYHIIPDHNTHTYPTNKLYYSSIYVSSLLYIIRDIVFDSIIHHSLPTIIVISVNISVIIICIL